VENPQPVFKEEPEKLKTPYKTVGTARISKSGNALSVKIIAENRFFHISRRDIELILQDINHATVANVREYDIPKSVISNGEKQSEG